MSISLCNLAAQAISNLLREATSLLDPQASKIQILTPISHPHTCSPRRQYPSCSGNLATAAPPPRSLASGSCWTPGAPPPQVLYFCTLAAEPLSPKSELSNPRFRDGSLASAARSRSHIVLRCIWVAGFFHRPHPVNLNVSQCSSRGVVVATAAPSSRLTLSNL